MRFTVQQYQDLHLIYKSEGTALDKSCEAIGLIYGLTQKEVDDLPMPEVSKKGGAIYNEYVEAVKNDKPCQILKAGSREYQINYNLSTFRSAQFTEIQGWMAGDLVANMDKILASCANPIKKTWWGKKVVKNDSDDHERVCEDMKQADFKDAYGCVVFFCQLFNDSIGAIQTYLESKIMNQITRRRMNQMLTDLRKPLDGFITQKESPSSAG